MSSTVPTRKTAGLKFLTCATILTIENVKKLLQLDCFSTLQFRSANFNSGADDTNSWCFNVCLGNGNIEYIITNTPKCQYVEALVSLSLLDTDGCKRYTKTLSKECGYGKGKNAFMTFQKILADSKLLPGGDLTLHCKITTVKKYDGSAKEFLIPANSIENDLSVLHCDGRLSDIILVVAGKEIKAHKAILSVRSPVFAAMFESGMKETLQNRVIISDLDYEVVQEMLHFIYTGKAPKLSGIADRLLVAADKYSLDALKAMCEQELYKTVSVDTVTELMALANLHSATQLKKRTEDFIKENIK